MNSSVTKPLAEQQRHPAVAIAQPEDEALERAAAGGARERGVDAEAVARDRPRDELEGVARAGPAERRLDDDLAALAGAVRPEQREAALEDLEGERRSARRARAVVVQDVGEGERDAPPPIDDLERGH
jgi:hypothetical protein